jgi:hypothetical protein
VGGPGGPALGWRADERVDDASLAGTLEFVGHAVALARSRGLV